jgi:hypothetical protein
MISRMNEVENLLWGALGIIAFVLLCYAGSRAAAVAWYRTKLEYLRSVMKEGNRNGEG